MKKNIKLILGMTLSAFMAIPFVAADVKSGPIEYTFMGLAVAIVVGFIVGAIFLIRFIIKKIKEKKQK